MSGFFAVSRKAFEEALPNLSNVGFKIMLDLLASAPHPLRTAEIPYTFRTRSEGESKLDAKVGQEFIILLLEKMFGHFLRSEEHTSELQSIRRISSAVYCL